MGKDAFFTEARRGFHAALLKSILRTDSNGVPSNADRASRQSVAIATGIMEKLGSESKGARLAAQMSGPIRPKVQRPPFAPLADAERFIDYAASQFPGSFYNEDGRGLLRMLRRAAKKADSGEPIARAFM